MPPGVSGLNERTSSSGYGLSALTRRRHRTESVFGTGAAEHIPAAPAGPVSAAPCVTAEVRAEKDDGDCFGSERDQDRGTVSVVLETEQGPMLADEEEYERRHRECDPAESEQ